MIGNNRGCKKRPCSNLIRRYYRVIAV